MYKIDDPEFVKLVEKDIPVKRLEKRLRPELGLGDYEKERKEHDDWSDYSKIGFLAIDESLLEVVYADWQVVERYGTTHLAIAKALDGAICEKYQLNPDYEFIKPNVFTGGTQSCPWGCGAYGQNAGVIVRKGIPEDKRNIAMMSQTPFVITGKKKRAEKQKKEEEPFYAPLTGLLPHLIGEHYFFEGKRLPFRADPAFLILALDLTGRS